MPFEGIFLVQLAAEDGDDVEMAVNTWTKRYEILKYSINHLRLVKAPHCILPCPIWAVKVLVN
jgi:hypothetical protein